MVELVDIWDTIEDMKWLCLWNLLYSSFLVLRYQRLKRLVSEVHCGKIFAGKSSESLQVWLCIDLCILCLPELAPPALRYYSGINNTIFNIPSNIIMPVLLYRHFACACSVSRNLALYH